MSLADIITLSREYGGNPDFVLAGGGNTSYKTETELFVKRSGVSLSGISEDGFVRLSRAALSKIISKSYNGSEAEVEAAVLADMLAARLPGEEAKRPSVEALLHGLFPQRFVVHLHPALVNGLTCSVGGGKLAQTLLGPRVVWLDEIKPGYTLATAAKRAMDDYAAKHGEPCRVLMLQNHGVFFAADTAEELRSDIAGLMSALRTAAPEAPNTSPAPADTALAAALAPAVRMLLGGGICVFKSPAALSEFICNEAAFAPLRYSYSPDHIVYCGAEPLFVPLSEDIEEQYRLLAEGISAHEARLGEKPKIIVFEGLGYFAAGPAKKDADTAAVVFLDAVKIAHYTRFFGGHRFMSSELTAFIRTWEVESYRKKVSLACSPAKRLAGKIAVITGGAQGFGEGIAEELLSEGALVAIADLNEAGARATAERFSESYGPGFALAVAADVSSEESVAALVRSVTLEYGGIDLFISNAGILRAGGLEEMDYKTFELMTRVNYSAYFLCAKHASAVMKLSHRFAPDKFFDIIQINSKSGLEGSNKNFAYAGGKFGGIGLTQSFALELTPYNIKVNAICPGNFFEGPLWNEPEKGLFVQYLRSGKVPGAKTVEDVKAFYEAKVPMGRGCRVRDVARAIMYLVEQEYETGQAVPVTGGQVMLS